MITYEQQASESMLYLASQIRGQAHLEAVIGEASLIAEGANTIKNMEAINEGIIESTKNALNKIAAFMKKMWNRFLEAMNNLVRTNKSYLEKYKDTILKNNFKEGVEYDMFNWEQGRRNMETIFNMPYSNEEQLKKDCADKSAYIQRHFQDMIRGYKPPYDETWADICKDYFHGGNQTITADTAYLNRNRKDMFDYCYNYATNTKQKLEKDYNTFMDNCAKQLDAIVKAQGSPQFKQESANFWENGKYYSYLYETYITEEENNAVQNIQDKINNTNAEITRLRREDATKNAAEIKRLEGVVAGLRQNLENAKKNSSQNNSNQNSAQKKDNNDQSQDQNKMNVDPNSQANAQELEKLGDAVSNYVNIGQVYLTSRMSAAEGCFKDYMKILKEHVKDVLGNQNPAQKSATAVSHNASNSNNNNQNTNQQQDNTNGFK